MSSLSTAEPAEKAKYEVGELALASHYGKLYVAKVFFSHSILHLPTTSFQSLDLFLFLFV